MPADAEARLRERPLPVLIRTRHSFAVDGAGFGPAVFVSLTQIRSLVLALPVCWLAAAEAQPLPQLLHLVLLGKQFRS